MPADLKHPFAESCCDGGACSTAESAQPCGCDTGCKPKPHYCADHQYKRAIPLLQEAIEMADDRADVIDGEDGHPRPDSWMRMLTLLQQIENILT